ncbi:MAG: polysaccharide deacetylase family protein [Armatimonadota bacterium]|nr:polysaccharide deacetylase family protein [Armatimonadota bacterium]
MGRAVSMGEPIVCLGFDCETDVGSWTPFYEGLQHGTPLLLEVLARTGVCATFFFTGDAASRHPQIVQQVAAAGHEVGCHSLYHETVGDPLFEIPGVKPLLPEEVPLRLRRATELVEKALGARPVSFRCPRLWGSTAVVNALEALGYEADASYPLYFYRERLAPYHPSRADWTREGDSRVLEIPNFADVTMESRDPYGRDRDQWPLFRTEGAAALMQRVQRFADYVGAHGLPVVLCFYFHPWEFWPMASEYHFGEGTVIPDPFITKNCGPYALQQLEDLIVRLQHFGASFATARSLAEKWSAV